MIAAHPGGGGGGHHGRHASVKVTGFKVEGFWLHLYTLGCVHLLSLLLFFEGAGHSSRFPVSTDCIQTG